jgi:hypothetical protein
MRRATLSLLAVLMFPVAARADDSFEIAKAPETKAKVGAKAAAAVTIKAKAGWHLNDQAPFSVELTPDPGVKVDKPKLGKADLKEKSPEKALFEVAFTASEPGKKKIAAKAKFVTCQGETVCRPVTENIQLALDVK